MYIEGWSWDPLNCGSFVQSVGLYIMLFLSSFEEGAEGSVEGLSALFFTDPFRCRQRSGWIRMCLGYGLFNQCCV